MRYGAKFRHSGLVVLLSVLAACSLKPVREPAPPLPAIETRPSGASEHAAPVTTPADLPAQTDTTSAPAVSTAPTATPTAPANTGVSSAQHIDDYRKDAARHIYQRMPERIYKGKMPPMLKAVVVVDLHIDPSGQVRVIDWVRVPKHAPEVKQDIEQAIRQSAPFPAPQYLRQVSFTETWLWHRTGRFQLDALTEGQH